MSKEWTERVEDTASALQKLDFAALGEALRKLDNNTLCSLVKKTNNELELRKMEARAALTRLENAST